MKASKHEFPIGQRSLGRQSTVLYFGQPARAPSPPSVRSHALLSGPPTLADSHQIFTSASRQRLGQKVAAALRLSRPWRPSPSWYDIGSALPSPQQVSCTGAGRGDGRGSAAGLPAEIGNACVCRPASSRRWQRRLVPWRSSVRSRSRRPGGKAAIEAMALRPHTRPPQRCSHLPALRHCSEELGRRTARPRRSPPAQVRAGSSTRSSARRRERARS